MKNYLTAWVYTMVLLLSACSRVSDEDMIGLYEPNFNVGYETLEIYEDGTYRHQFQSDFNVIVENTGDWTLENIEKQTYISLKGYIFSSIKESSSPWHQNQGEPIAFQARVVIGRNRSIRITVDEDEAFYYFKE